MIPNHKVITNSYNYWYVYDINIFYIKATFVFILCFYPQCSGHDIEFIF